jgi:GTP-binding protein Era
MIKSEIIRKINEISVPVLLLINKIDLADQNAVAALVDLWQKEIPELKYGHISHPSPNLAGIIDRIITLLPEHPPFFPQGQLSDRPNAFLWKRSSVKRYFCIMQRNPLFNACRD